MTTHHLKTVEAPTLKRWLDEEKAVLLDVRESDEYAREHIPQARLTPLSGFAESDFAADHGKVAVFHCQSGARTTEAAARLMQSGFAECYQLKGGLAGWKAAGFNVNINRKAPISIMRQVQITAGSLTLLGIVLAVLISPWFAALSAFVGAGLTFAGLTGTCALASILSRMPWNRPHSDPSPEVPAPAHS